MKCAKFHKMIGDRLEGTIRPQDRVRLEVLLDLFGLPGSCSVGFVTGCQMASVTCLAAARRGARGRGSLDRRRDLRDRHRRRRRAAGSCSATRIP